MQPETAKKKKKKKEYPFFTCDIYKFWSLIFIPEPYFVLNREKQKYI